MRVIRDYKTQDERENIEKEMKNLGFRLIEEQHHFDGEHLVFEDDTPETPYWQIIMLVRRHDEELRVVKEKLGIKKENQ